MMVNLEGYDWERELRNWVERTPAGLNRHFTIQPYGKKSKFFNVRLSWVTEDGTVWVDQRYSVSCKEAVFLVLERFDTWLASQIKKQFQIGVVSDDNMEAMQTRCNRAREI